MSSVVEEIFPNLIKFPLISAQNLIYDLHLSLGPSAVTELLTAPASLLSDWNEAARVSNLEVEVRRRSPRGEEVWTYLDRFQSSCCEFWQENSVMSFHYVCRDLQRG